MFCVSSAIFLTLIECAQMITETSLLPQAAKPPDLNPETEESIPSRSSPEGPDPPVLTEVSKQDEQQPLDLEGVKRKMDQGNYVSVVCLKHVTKFQVFLSVSLTLWEYSWV